MRPIGINVMKVCEVLDNTGQPMTYAKVSERLPEVGLHNTSKYLVRAEKLGLATCNREVKPYKYQIVKGWYEVATAKRQRKAEKPAARINSVWQLGAQ